MSIEITTTDAATKSGILDALGTKAYTQSEKTKLEGLETSKYKGLYVDFDSLTGAYPTGEGGYYADVDSGVAEDVVRYIYDVDDTGWVLQLGESTAETAASIKTKYESNANTNALTDANLDRITGDNFSVVGDLTVDSTTLHVDSSNDRVGIGTNTPFHTLDVAGNTALGFETLFVDGNNLNVGIGTTSPDSSYKLDVNGDTRINGTIYNIQDLDVNGNAIISLGYLACSNFYDGGGFSQWGSESGGTFTFNGAVNIGGQVEATSQAASTDDSLMTRSLGDARYARTLISYKTANEDKTNDATAADDQHLALTLEANSVYVFEIQMTYQTQVASGHGGVRFSSSQPAGSSIEAVYNLAGSGAARAIGRRFTTATPDITVIFGQINAEANIIIKGTIATSSTAGTFAPQWAQNSSNANWTRILKGSYMIAHKIQ